MARRFDVGKAVRDATIANASTAEQATAKPSTRARRNTTTKPTGKGGAGAEDEQKSTSKPAQTSRRTSAHLTPVTDNPQLLEKVFDAVAAVDEQILHRGGEPAKLAKRVHVPLPEDLFRYLKRRNAEDDIDTTVRIRAMIELYEQDERHRGRVDKIAKKRNEELIRHRWG